MQDQQQSSNETDGQIDDNSAIVNIQPSEPNDESLNQDEENAPGRTPGKAEGSLEIIEEDLARNEKA